MCYIGKNCEAGVCTLYPYLNFVLLMECYGSATSLEVLAWKTLVCQSD